MPHIYSQHHQNILSLITREALVSNITQRQWEREGTYSKIAEDRTRKERGLCLDGTRVMQEYAGPCWPIPHPTPPCHVPANMPCVGTHKRDDGVSCQRQPDKCYYNLVGTSCQRQPLQCHQNWGWAPEMIDCCFERHSYKPKESCCASLLGGLCSHKTAGDSGMLCVTVWSELVLGSHSFAKISMAALIFLLFAITNVTSLTILLQT